MTMAFITSTNAAPTNRISSQDAMLVNDLTTLLSCAINTSGNSVSQPLKRSATKLQQLFLAPPQPQLQEPCFWLPGLSLKQQQQQQTVPPGDAKRNNTNNNKNNNNKHALQDAAAQQLNVLLQVTHSDLPQIPMRLLWNLSKSLLHLVDARLRSSVLALVQQSQNSHHRSDLLRSPAIKRLLSSSQPPPITPTTIITTFKTFTHQAEQIQENMYIAPLVLEAVVDVNVLGILQTVKIGAMGTVTCALDVATNKLACAEIKLDTAALLQTMMGEARALVKQAIARAFGVHEQQQQSLAFLQHQQHQQQLLGNLSHHPGDNNHFTMADDSQNIDGSQNNDGSHNSGFGGGEDNDNGNNNDMPPPQPFVVYSQQQQQQQSGNNNNNNRSGIQNNSNYPQQLQSGNNNHNNSMIHSNDERMMAQPQQVSSYGNFGTMMMGDYDFQDDQNLQQQQLWHAQQLQQMMLMQQQNDEDLQQQQQQQMYQQNQEQQQRQQQMYQQHQHHAVNVKQDLMHQHHQTVNVKQEMDEEPQYNHHHCPQEEDEDMHHGDSSGGGDFHRIDRLTAAIMSLQKKSTTATTT